MMTDQTLARPALVCVGPNTSLDRTLRLDSLELGAVNRVTAVVEQAGGKAANVARVARSLGADPMLIGPAGGRTGDEVVRLAEFEGLRCQWIESVKPTRTCATLVTANGIVTDINEPGELGAGEWQALLDAVSSASADAALVLVCGSLPSVPVSNPMGALLDAIHPTAAVWVDTSGEPLVAALRHPRRLDMVKINLAEAAAVMGVAEPDALDHRSCADLVDHVHQRAGGDVVITMGEGGAIFARGDEQWHARHNVAAICNPTGSGDAFMAGLGVGLGVEALSPPDALRLATACGSANVGRFAAGIGDRARVEALLESVVVTSVRR